MIVSLGGGKAQESIVLPSKIAGEERGLKTHRQKARVGPNQAGSAGSARRRGNTQARNEGHPAQSTDLNAIRMVTVFLNARTGGAPVPELGRRKSKWYGIRSLKRGPRSCLLTL